MSLPLILGPELGFIPTHQGWDPDEGTAGNGYNTQRRAASHSI